MRPEPISIRANKPDNIATAQLEFACVSTARFDAYCVGKGRHTSGFGKSLFIRGLQLGAD